MKIDSTTLLIGVAVIAGAYLLTRPKVPTYLPTSVNPYGTAGLPSATVLSQQYYGNPTAQDIAAGGTALDGLSSLIGNFF